MASLLAIPWEIRAIILDLILFTPCLPRHSSPDFHLAALTTKGLLLTNRQLHAEALSRLRDHDPFAYHFTMNIHDESGSTRAWTHVPVIAKHVPIVHVTVTATGSRPKEAYHTAFDGGDGGPPTIAWFFYDPLKHFTMHHSYSRDPTQAVNHSIGLLDINVVTPSLEPNQAFDPRGGPPRLYWPDPNRINMEPTIDYVMTPDFLADFLVGHMGMLLAMSYHTASYAAFLYSSIGSIRISVDGEVKQSWNLGHLLAAFPPNGPVESFSKGRVGDWKEFYASAIASRKKHGLCVREVSAQET